MAIDADEVNSEEVKDDNDAARKRLAWANAPENRRAFWAYWSIIAVTGVIAISFLVIGAREAHLSFTSFKIDWHVEWPYIVTAGFTTFFGLSIARSVLSIYRQRFDDRVLIESQAQLAGAESRLAETGDLDLPGLWAITQRRLDYYHEIATNQAKHSFRNAQAAMTIGFLILVITIALSLTARSTVGSIVAGTLGAVGATLASYIGRTFIRSQESTAEHLRSYFDQPLEFSRFLAAERLLSTINQEARPAAVEQMIEAMVKGSIPEKHSGPPPSS